MTDEELISAIEKRIAQADPAWDFIPVLREAVKRLKTGSGEREKRYEYGIPPVLIYGIYQTLSAAEMQKALLERSGYPYTIVRRKVGEWEEVKE